MYPSLHKTRIHRTLSACLAFVLMITQTVLNPVMAQNAPDVESPIIELEAVLEADAGDTQVFTALVADDKQLKDVTLYHRRSGRAPFERAAMSPLGTTGYYSVNLPTDPTDLRAIEYYIQARDQGGNRSVSGFAFDPYSRNINASTVAAKPTVSTTPEPIAQPTVASVDITTKPEADNSNRKWWGVAIAVVVLGALAASSGGDSGSDPDRAELTINLPLPQ